MGWLFMLSPCARAMDFSWNGFGSAYYGQALTSDPLPYGFTDQHVNFATFSLMGLNVGAKIDNDFSFVMQIVALGNPVGSTDSFELIAQWAYANYTPTEATSFRIGRQLYPVLMASEYQRVAYLLPFRQVPIEASRIAPFTRFDGLAALYTADLGFGKLTLEAFGGDPVLDLNSNALAAGGREFKFADLLGAQATLDGDGWRVRALASRDYAQLGSTSGVVATSGHTQVFSVGGRYDRANVVAWGEYIFTQTPDGTPVGGGRFLGVGHGYYVSGGYRIGRLMPHYTFAQGSETFNASSGNDNATSHVIGFNYHAGQAVIRLEYEDVLVPLVQTRSFFVNQSSSSSSTSAGALYAGVDFIF